MKVKLFSILILLGISGYSQEEAGSYSFTLEEAKEFALKNSYTMRSMDKEVEKSERKVKETISTGLPQISATGSYQNFIKLPVQLIPAESFGGPKGSFQQVVFGLEQTMGASITASQLIFDGSYLVGLKAAKVYLELSKNDWKKSEIETKNMVTQAYGNVLVTESNIEILKTNTANLEKIVYETTELYKSGFAEEQDKDQFTLLLSNTKNAFELAVRQSEIAKNQLKFILGIDLESSITLKDELSVITSISNSEAFSTADFDVNTHIDYKSVLTQEKATHLLYKQEQSGYLPSLSAFYNYQQNSFSNEFNFLSDAPWFTTQVVGVNLKVPIFSSFYRHHKVQQAKIDVERVEIAKKQIGEQLKLQAKNAKSEYLFALNQYESMNESLSLAERIYDNVKEKYDEGMSSGLDLSVANNQLLSSQTNFINASLQLINSKINLDKALNNY